MNMSNFKAAFLSILALGIVATAPSTARAENIPIAVWKSPTCGCCKGWVEYMEDNGFDVTIHDMYDVQPMKRELGLTDPSLYSCHTAKVGNYLVEGHVPADDVKRMLEEEPNILGLTAPGMPQMSPGMASIVPKGYNVLEVYVNQETGVYSRY